MGKKGNILESVPKDIKDVTKISVIITTIFFVISIIFRQSYIISLTVGMVASTIGGILIIYDVYKLVQLGVGNKITVGIFGKFKRLFIYAVALLFVVFLSRKYFPNAVRINIIFGGIGLLNYKLSMMIYQWLKLRKK